MTLPQPKVEIRFDGTNWDDITAWVRMPDGINLQRGRDDETGDPLSVGTCTLSLDNNAGEFTPGLTSSANYPYVVAGVAVRVSMWTGAAYSVRFYGTVQKWQVSWLNPVGTQAKVTVTATGTVGDFPSYTMKQASDEVVLKYSPMHYWPLHDSEEPAQPLAGAAKLFGNGGDGWGGAAPLPMDDSGDHPLFTSSVGKLTLTTTELAASPYWKVLLVILSAPTANGSILKVGPRTITWSTSGGFDISPGVALGPTGLPSSWPVVLEVSSADTSSLYGQIRAWEADGSGVGTFADSATLLGGTLSTLVLNPTLTGGSEWGGAHLAVFRNDDDTLLPPANTIAKELISSTRVPITGSAVSTIGDRFRMSVAGATPGNTVLPQVEGRTGSDILAALATGTGARIIDDLDGTLTWQEFPPSGTPIALPAFEIDPELTWETSDIGWTSDATVTWPDGSSYTATRPDGKRSSMSFEGVHADRDRDRSWADWLVWNTASTGQARMPAAPYDLATLSDADSATLASVTVGSRISLSGLPSQMPSTLTLIVEGIDEQITDSRWLVTFKTSPDVYSRLFILDDPVQSVLDAGYLLAP